MQYMAAPPVGLVIRRARERKRWTQRDLAKAVGVSRASVDAWENSRTYPRNRIGALEEVLGISLDGQPGPVPDTSVGPLDDLKPWQEPWEEEVAADEGLPVETRRWLITDSRRARVAHAERKRSRMAQSPRDRDREAG